MSYQTLQDDIAAFLDNQDVVDKIPTFIRLCETRLNRVVRTRQMENRVTTAISTQFSTLPSDFQEMRNIQINTTPVTALQYVTPQEADKIMQKNHARKTRFFSIVANRLELIPPPTNTLTVEMVYYAQIPALSGENPSNWMLEQHYDAYLYGALVQGALYLKDDATTWATLFDSAIDEIEKNDDQSQFHGTTPQVRGLTIG